MGVAPTEETAVLLQQIRDNTLTNPVPPQPKIITPNKPSQSPPPFLAGPPVTQPAGFFGRQREIKRIFNLLGYLPMQNAAIIGPRRSGKTSLLHYLKNSATLPQHQWIFIDFQDTRMGDRTYLLHYLLAEMGLPQPEPCDLENFMEVVSDELQESTVVLMDEIGVALQRYPELDETFWESLRSLATNQVGGRLGFVLAGAESPGQLAQQSGMGSPFFNIFGYVATMGPLTEPEARELIASAPVPFAEEDVAWILVESGRWPVLLQILCRERLLTLEEGITDTQWREEARAQLTPFMYLKEA
ncbi:MAG: AAA family ATPase [Anaerolineae bacterium]|nr:AAA family ATPase [Anaerolineae bacterium]